MQQRRDEMNDQPVVLGVENWFSIKLKMAMINDYRFLTRKNETPPKNYYVHKAKETQESLRAVATLINELADEIEEQSRINGANQ